MIGNQPIEWCLKCTSTGVTNVSKRDYELIAKVINNYLAGVTGGQQHRESLARAFGSELLNTNPRFDLKRFIAACVKETTHVA